MAGVAYYPGCSLKHSAAEYDQSTRIVLEALKQYREQAPGVPKIINLPDGVRVTLVRHTA